MRGTQGPALGRLRWLLACGALGLCLGAGLLAAPGAAPVTVGDVSASDLITPVDLALSPAVGDTRIAMRDGSLLPLVARLEAGAAEAAERSLNEGFARARDAFGGAVEQAFGTRILSEEKIASLRFGAVRDAFVATHEGFPVGHVLASAWARGEDGELVRLRLAHALQQVMGRRLIGALPQSATVFVVDLPAGQGVRSWAEAAPMLVRAVDPDQVVTAAAARAELWRQLGVGERLAGGFLETLVRDTVVHDPRLTALFLRERLGDQWEGRFFGRGEPIVRAGERVDAVAAEALGQLHALGLAPLAPMGAGVPAPAPPSAVAGGPEGVAGPVALPRPAPMVQAAEMPVLRRPALPTAWVMLTAVAGGVSLALGAWGFLRLRRLRGATTPGRPRGQPDLRAVLAREMTRQGMDALFTQRQELLKSAEVATDRMERLETRVAQVQPALQERMQHYEQRIKALERELQER